MRLDRLGAEPGDPRVAAEALVEEARPDRLGVGVDERERRLRVVHRPGRVGEARDARGGGVEVHAVAPGTRLGLGDLVPELERALVVRERLREGVPRLGRAGRCEGRVEGARQVVGRVPVPRELGQARVVAVGPCLLEAAREGGVQARPLAREQVVVDRLLEQRVAERVVLVAGTGLGHQDVLADGFAQRGVQGLGVDARRVHEQVGSTCWPAAEATRRTSWVASVRRATRASRTSRSVGGSSAVPVSRAEHRSSSAKNGFPWDRAWIDSTRPGSTSRPLIARSWAVSSAPSKRRRSSRSTRPERSSSARNGSSGWRRCSSSDR